MTRRMDPRRKAFIEAQVRYARAFSKYRERLKRLGLKVGGEHSCRLEQMSDEEVTAELEEATEALWSVVFPPDDVGRTP